MTIVPEQYIVFGYGSLIWKPPPHSIQQIPGFLKGYVRRFAQSSSDHRGTPEAPGRVVTLIHSEDWEAFAENDPFPEEDVVWGVAHTIDPQYAEEVKAYLDHREQEGYTEERIDVWGYDPEGRECIVVHGATVYVGHRNNPAFVGSEPIDQLAQRIHRSHGPSGPNKEYLYKLYEAVQTLAPQSFDSHLDALDRGVRLLDKMSLPLPSPEPENEFTEIEQKRQLQVC